MYDRLKSFRKVFIMKEERCQLGCMKRNTKAHTSVNKDVICMAVFVCKVRGPTKTREVPSDKAMKMIIY